MAEAAMAREILIEIYLAFFKAVFALFKWLPLQEKVTFVVSFKANPLAVYKEMERLNFPGKVVFLCKGNCYRSVKNAVKEKVYRIESNHLFHELAGIYHLATSKAIIVDNYYGFLAAASFKKGVECIQIWHAAGAVKTFGLKDKTIRNRSKRALKRFKKVYKQFHKVVVGSEEFGKIFQEAFQLSEANILPTGVPRTDFFYDRERHEEIRKDFYRKYPELKGKKIVLYAPTYRDYEEERALSLDVGRLYERWKGEYALLIRLHPSVQDRLDFDDYKGFAYDFSRYPEINDLLVIADYLVSDYSSVPFEYAILEKPMVFFPYDLEKYERERGLWKKYEELVPGPIVRSTEELIACIENDSFDREKIRAFKETWNAYSQGFSSRNLVLYLSDSLALPQVQKRGMETTPL
ncbi:MAG: CDP-glycerol glycerophosphotransferase family protein [Bacillaceae bacterium]